MHYHVARGLREIVAPRQIISKAHWKTVLEEFGGLCIFCGSAETAENRGIVPDHLLPVTQFGELVLGNTVPACQTCNDSRGDRDWRPFLRQVYPGNADEQIRRVESHVEKYAYRPVTVGGALSSAEQQAYIALLHAWDKMLEKAKRLRDAANKRRKGSD